MKTHSEGEGRILSIFHWTEVASSYPIYWTWKFFFFFYHTCTPQTNKDLMKHDNMKKTIKSILMPVQHNCGQICF